MSNGLIVREFDGHTIRTTDGGYFNAEDMADAAGKGRTFASDWAKSDQCREYVAIAVKILKSEISDLIIQKQGRGDRGGGTWFHPKIARRFAQACSADWPGGLMRSLKLQLMTDRSRRLNTT